MPQMQKELMWPKLVLNKVLRKSIGSNNFVGDLPVSSREFPEILPSDQYRGTCNAHTCKIFVSSWNVGGIAPPARMDLQEDWLNIQNPSDIYVLGFQEIVPLSAGNVFGSENSRISHRWNNKIGEVLNGSRSKWNFRCVVSKQMVGIFISIWVREDMCEFISYPSVSCVGCGVMGCLGNKGSVSVRFLFRRTSFCFVCSHLASGGKEGDERHRNADAAEILSRTSFPRGPSHVLPAKILDHDRVIWLGDFNYRIHLPGTMTRYLVEKGNWNILLENDELKAEFIEGHVFQGWQEGVIKFAPTYKYYPDSEIYYGGALDRKSKKSRAPAWCDRIIWFGEGLTQSRYDRGESRLSDHRPVRAVFTAEIEPFRVHPKNR